MEFFRIHKDIPFMRHALVFNLVSAVTFALAVFFLVTKGLHLSVEFTGGTVVEVAYSQPAQIDKVRGAVEKLGYKDVLVQNFGSSRDVMIRLPLQKGVSSSQQSGNLMAAIKAQSPDVALRRVEFVGPQVGEERSRHFRRRHRAGPQAAGRRREGPRRLRDDGQDTPHVAPRCADTRHRGEL